VKDKKIPMVKSIDRNAIQPRPRTESPAPVKNAGVRKRAFGDKT
jgi:hypothetical protein